MNEDEEIVIEQQVKEDAESEEGSEEREGRNREGVRIGERMRQLEDRVDMKEWIRNTKEGWEKLSKEELERRTVIIQKSMDIWNKEDREWKETNWELRKEGRRREEKKKKEGEKKREWIRQEVERRKEEWGRGIVRRLWKHEKKGAWGRDYERMRGRCRHCGKRKMWMLMQGGNIEMELKPCWVCGEEVCRDCEKDRKGKCIWEERKNANTKNPTRG